MVKLITGFMYYKGGDIMAVKCTSRKPLFGNRRSHALNATKHTQKLNLQNVTLSDGTKIKVSTREAKKYRKDMKESN